MKQNFFHRYLSAKVLPIWTILLIDIFIIVASCLLAYSLRYDFRSIFLDSSTIDKTILWTVPSQKDTDEKNSVSFVLQFLF